MSSPNFLNWLAMLVLIFIIGTLGIFITEQDPKVVAEIAAEKAKIEVKINSAKDNGLKEFDVYIQRTEIIAGNGYLHCMLLTDKGIFRVWSPQGINLQLINSKRYQMEELVMKMQVNTCFRIVVKGFFIKAGKEVPCQ